MKNNPSSHPPRPPTNTELFVKTTVENYRFLAKHIKHNQTIDFVCYIGNKTFFPVLINVIGSNELFILSQVGVGHENRIYTTINQVTFDIIIGRKDESEPAFKPRECGFKHIWEHDMAINAES